MLASCQLILKIEWKIPDHQFLIAKFRFKLKDVGENHSASGHKLNQIPYEYAVGVTNRFKGLELVNSVPEELWTEVHKLYRKQLTKPSPQKKSKKAK